MSKLLNKILNKKANTHLFNKDFGDYVASFEFEGDESNHTPSEQASLVSTKTFVSSVLEQIEEQTRRAPEIAALHIPDQKYIDPKESHNYPAKPLYEKLFYQDNFLSDKLLSELTANVMDEGRSKELFTTMNDAHLFKHAYRAFKTYNSELSEGEQVSEARIGDALAMLPTIYNYFKETQKEACATKIPESKVNPELTHYPDTGITIK